MILQPLVFPALTYVVKLSIDFMSVEMNLVLEVGDVSNQLISIICRHLAGNLQSFSFVGGQVSIS